MSSKRPPPSQSGAQYVMRGMSATERRFLHESGRLEAQRRADAASAPARLSVEQQARLLPVDCFTNRTDKSSNDEGYVTGRPPTFVLRHPSHAPAAPLVATHDALPFDLDALDAKLLEVQTNTARLMRSALRDTLNVDKSSRGSSSRSNRSSSARSSARRVRRSAEITVEAVRQSLQESYEQGSASARSQKSTEVPSTTSSTSTRRSKQTAVIESARSSVEAEDVRASRSSSRASAPEEPPLLVATKKVKRKKKKEVEREVEKDRTPSELERECKTTHRAARDSEILQDYIRRKKRERKEEPRKEQTDVHASHVHGSKCRGQQLDSEAIRRWEMERERQKRIEQNVRRLEAAKASRRREERVAAVAAKQRELASVPISTILYGEHRKEKRSKSDVQKKRRVKDVERRAAGASAERLNVPGTSYVKNIPPSSIPASQHKEAEVLRWTARDILEYLLRDPSPPPIRQADDDFCSSSSCDFSLASSLSARLRAGEGVDLSVLETPRRQSALHPVIPDVVPTQDQPSSSARTTVGSSSQPLTARDSQQQDSGAVVTDSSARTVSSVQVQSSRSAASVASLTGSVVVSAVNNSGSATPVVELQSKTISQASSVETVKSVQEESVPTESNIPTESVVTAKQQSSVDIVSTASVPEEVPSVESNTASAVQSSSTSKHSQSTTSIKIASASIKTASASNSSTVKNDKKSVSKSQSVSSSQTSSVSEVPTVDIDSAKEVGGSKNDKSPSVDTARSAAETVKSADHTADSSWAQEQAVFGADITRNARRVLHSQHTDALRALADYTAAQLALLHKREGASEGHDIRDAIRNVMQEYEKQRQELKQPQQCGHEIAVQEHEARLEQLRRATVSLQDQISAVSSNVLDLSAVGSGLGDVSGAGADLWMDVESVTSKRRDELAVRQERAQRMLEERKAIAQTEQAVAKLEREAMHAWMTAAPVEPRGEVMPPSRRDVPKIAEVSKELSSSVPESPSASSLEREARIMALREQLEERRAMAHKLKAECRQRNRDRLEENARSMQRQIKAYDSYISEAQSRLISLQKDDGSARSATPPRISPRPPSVRETQTRPQTRKQEASPTSTPHPMVPLLDLADMQDRSFGADPVVNPSNVPLIIDMTERQDTDDDVSSVANDEEIRMDAVSEEPTPVESSKSDATVTPVESARQPDVVDSRVSEPTVTRLTTQMEDDFFKEVVGQCVAEHRAAQVMEKTVSKGTDTAASNSGKADEITNAIFDSLLQDVIKSAITAFNRSRTLPPQPPHTPPNHTTRPRSPQTSSPRSTQSHSPRSPKTTSPVDKFMAVWDKSPRKPTHDVQQDIVLDLSDTSEHEDPQSSHTLDTPKPRHDAAPRRSLDLGLPQDHTLHLPRARSQLQTLVRAALDGADPHRAIATINRDEASNRASRDFVSLVTDWCREMVADQSEEPKENMKEVVHPWSKPERLRVRRGPASADELTDRISYRLLRRRPSAAPVPRFERVAARKLPHSERLLLEEVYAEEREWTVFDEEEESAMYVQAEMLWDILLEEMCALPWLKSRKAQLVQYVT